MAKKVITKEQGRIFKVPSVETRLKVLSRLKKGSMCVNALACRLWISAKGRSCSTCGSCARRD